MRTDRVVPASAASRVALRKRSSSSWIVVLMARKNVRRHNDAEPEPGICGVTRFVRLRRTVPTAGRLSLTCLP